LRLWTGAKPQGDWPCSNKKRAELEAERKALAEKLMVHGALAQRTCMGHLLSGSFAGRLVGPVLERVIKRQMRTNLETLKALLEGR
jgi:hypothetical protein